MSLICPTVLAATKSDFDRALSNVEFASRIQVDIADGQFAKPASLDPAQLNWGENIKVDVHVMFDDPASVVSMLMLKGPNLVIVHAESSTFSEALNKLKEHKIATGLALLPETKPEDVPELSDVSHCLIFGGNLGSYGGQADLTQLKKVQMIKQINPDIEVGWDGGVNDQNVKHLVEGGVDVVNVGSFIQQNSRPQDAYAKLVEKVKEVGS